MVLYSGGLLLNVSAMPWGPGQKLRREAHDARGTVMINAGIAPGITNLAAADFVAKHSETDEIELVFAVSVNNGAGRAGREFAHRGVTAVAHHRTARIPLPPLTRAAALDSQSRPAGGSAPSPAHGPSVHTSASPRDRPTPPCWRRTGRG